MGRVRFAVAAAAAPAVAARTVVEEVAAAGLVVTEPVPPRGTRTAVPEKAKETLAMKGSHRAMTRVPAMTVHLRVVMAIHLRLVWFPKWCKKRIL
jgi:hypothetical protein